MDESVPGLGPSRDMVRWAFNEETNLNEPNFFDLENKYVIAILTNVSDGETKKLSDVYDEIKSILINKSASLKLRNSIENLNLSTMVEISKEFNLPIKSISNLRMNGDVFGSEGANSELVGEFFGLSKDQSPHLFISEKGV